MAILIINIDAPLRIERPPGRYKRHYNPPSLQPSMRLFISIALLSINDYLSIACVHQVFLLFIQLSLDFLLLFSFFNFIKTAAPYIRPMIMLM